MRVFHCETFTLELPAGHRFPASKYTRLQQRVSGLNNNDIAIDAAPAVSREQLCLAHDSDYITRVFEGRLLAADLRALGFPWSPQLVERSRRSVGATMAAAEAAREEGIAVSLAGGTHHADYAGGAGFCVFNDVAVTALNMLRAEPGLKLLVFDCDVHQGDGSARILAETGGVYTCSIHSARNYPHHKASSDFDIGLPDGTTDEVYLKMLKTALVHAVKVARPQLLLYIAGADVYADDRLGRLSLSTAGIAARDELVLSYAERHQIPVAVLMGGGYAPDIDAIVDIHSATVASAVASWARRTRPVSGQSGAV